MAKPTGINPQNTVFVLLSFEGPDQYSQAGGLGVRVTELSGTLASLGYETHLVFVGDPREPGTEPRQGGKLQLHRWGQWISKYYPEGVYAGENEKLYDFNESVPWFIMDNIVRPAAAADKMVVVMGEEWHTAEAMCRLSDLLYFHGLRDRAIQAWTANNTMSFHRINWGRLNYTNTLMTVSRYMKHIMWDIGMNPLVVPNGIPSRLLEPVDENASARLRSIMDSDLFLFKVGRFDPDKRWNMAVEAAARLKSMGVRVKFLLRGGIEPHEGEVLHNARSHGLTVTDVRTSTRVRTMDEAFRALEQAGDADVYNIKFFVPEDFLRVIYHSADAVLANSGHEPFGLVGLEVMAAEGIAFTGATGEDYAIPFLNAMVAETSDPGEIVRYLIYLKQHPEAQKDMRREGKHTAMDFTWENVIRNLNSKLEYIATNQGLIGGGLSLG
jgi:glycosyltransferase involved in cell wall biosynthesis